MEKKQEICNKCNQYPQNCECNVQSVKDAREREKEFYNPKVAEKIIEEDNKKKEIRNMPSQGELF